MSSFGSVLQIRLCWRLDQSRKDCSSNFDIDMMKFRHGWILVEDVKELGEMVLGISLLAEFQ